MFDGKSAAPELLHAIGEADAVLVSIPQDETRRSGAAPRAAMRSPTRRTSRRSSICRRSAFTATAPASGSTRRFAAASRIRRAAPNGSAPNAAGRISAHAAALPVAVLRLAGIYGPGRNALTQMARGDARRIVKPGQVFNRIHVEDIAQAIDAALARRASGFSTSPTTSRRRRASRSHSRRNSSAWRRRLKWLSKTAEGRCRRSPKASGRNAAA